MQSRGQCPEMGNYNQCPCMQKMPCGCEMNGQMGAMGSTAEPGPAVPGVMPGAPPTTIIPPAPLLPGNIPPEQARPMPAVPSKNTRTVQPAAKTEGN
ncbi:MAG TPA: hypothetical protein VGZ47_14185 [Gemmataceae bacterium]|nr:hypothetical protein [Gemmataceae bacterium]